MTRERENAERISSYSEGISRIGHQKSLVLTYGVLSCYDHVQICFPDMALHTRHRKPQ